MPPAKKRKPRARRSSPVAWPTLPALEQRQLDLIGLALVAAGIFFAGLIYLHWDGGDGGHWALDGLRTLIGAVHYGFPVALIAIGALVVLGPMLPAVRPFRAGGLCLFGALLIGLAAGTAGLGPGGTAVHWDAAWVRPRGGVVGEGLYWLISSAVGTVGAHIVAVFLFLAAVLLLTGASVAGVVKATTSSVSTTTRDMRAAVQRRRATDELALAEIGEPRVSRMEPIWDDPPTEVVEPEPLPDTRTRARASSRRNPVSPRIPRPTSRGSPGPPSIRTSSPRRGATARRSPTHPTSSGPSRTPHSSSARPRRPRGRTRQARRRSPHS